MQLQLQIQGSLHYGGKSAAFGRDDVFWGGEREVTATTEAATTAAATAKATAKATTKATATTRKTKLSCDG